MNEQFDRYGRLLYNPEYHFNQGKPWTKEELTYLCSMHRNMHGGMKSLSLAIGRTETTCATKIGYLQKQGRYEYYKKLGEMI